MAKKGTVITNGIILQTHEQATVQLLTNNGYDIVLIKPSTIQGAKTADMFIDGIPWEMKSPAGKGKWTIKNIIQKASHQCENIIIDLRRLNRFPQKKYVEEVKMRFELMNRQTAIHYILYDDHVAVLHYLLKGHDKL